MKKIDEVLKECVICGEEFLSPLKKECCSVKCTELNRIVKIKRTKLLKYGSIGFNNREKAKDTCIIKYGVDNPRKDPEVVQKGKDTSILKYGCENPAQSDIVKNKRKITCQEKYGTDYASSNPEVIKKIGDTIESRFGVRSVFSDRKYMESSFETKYGTGIKNAQQIPGIAKKTHETRKSLYELFGAVKKESSENTCLEKYGNKTFFGSNIGKMSFENLRKHYGFSDDEISELGRKKDSCSATAFATKYADPQVANEKRKDRLLQFDSMSWNWALTSAGGNESLAKDIFISRQVTRKNKPGVASKASLRVFEIVEEELVNLRLVTAEEVYVGDNKRKEYFLRDTELGRVYFYDFTLPKVKVIIEYNGCYYHPKTKEQDPRKWEREQRKRHIAEQNGFTLITVWDDIPATEICNDIIKEIKKCLKM